MSSAVEINPSHVRKLVEGMPASAAQATLRDKHPEAKMADIEAAIDGALSEKAADDELKRAAGEGRNGTSRHLHALDLQGIEAQSVRWLWDGRIPAGTEVMPVVVAQQSVTP